MQDACANSATRMRKDDAHILKDCPCDLQTCWRITRILLSRDRSAGAARDFASYRHHCATILQHYRCGKSDRSRWHQRDHSVEEVRVSKGTSQMRERSRFGMPMPTRSEGLCSTKAKTGDGEMRIAQVAPLTEAVPPKLYGGTERVVSWLTEELVSLGHDVTLFASGDSRTTAKLEPMWPRALRLDDSVLDPMALHMLMLERVRQWANEFDCL